MKKQRIFSLFFFLFLFLLNFKLAHAASNIINQPADLPPGAMNFGADATPYGDPNIIAAIIGVVGLMIGSLITILATYFIRWLDIRREDQKDEMMMERMTFEKQYQMKQEIYKQLLNELALLETFQIKDLENFNKELTKAEIKLDLISSEKVRSTKDLLKRELQNLASINLKNNSADLSQTYLNLREELLFAIREDLKMS